MTRSIDQEVSFETLLREFDEIVASLESDDLALEDAIDKYELAAQLAARCTSILENAELRIRQIDDELDGNRQN